MYSYDFSTKVLFLKLSTMITESRRVYELWKKVQSWMIFTNKSEGKSFAHLLRVLQSHVDRLGTCSGNIKLKSLSYILYLVYNSLVFKVYCKELFFLKNFFLEFCYFHRPCLIFLLLYIYICDLVYSYIQAWNCC